MIPFLKETDDNYDPNVEIDRIIEERLFDEKFSNRELDEMQYNFEMRPYIYPDVEKY